MKVTLTITETKNYTFDIPKKYFKQLKNPKNRAILLAELFNQWEHNDDCNTWIDDATVEELTFTDSGLNVLPTNLSSTERNFYDKL